jgi:hypothetical protein
MGMSMASAAPETESVRTTANARIDIMTVLLVQAGQCAGVTRTSM